MAVQPKSGGGITPALVLAALGFPAVFSIVYAATDKPLHALALMVVYGGILFIIGAFRGVWGKIQPRLEQETADDLWKKLGIRTRRHYHRAYLQHLIYSHRTFDVKGMSTQGPYALELEQVFVDLSISPEARFSAAAVVPEELRTGGHSIARFLSNPNVGHLAVIGAPGCGKTTLLKHLTLALADKTKKHADESLLDKLPVLLFLRDHARTIGENPDVPLVTLIRNSLILMPDKAPEGWFEEYLKKGCCLVMLDGLDEVADPEIRRKVVTWVEKQLGACGGNCFIVTSRPHGYRSNTVSGLTLLEIRPFNRAQIEKFVRNWYLANEVMSYQKRDPGVEMEARQGAEDLLRRIHGSVDIAELAVNPLLLTMIATVHRFRSSLPGRRVELYAEMCEVLLGKRQSARDLLDDLTPAQKQSVLQPLAYEMMCHQQRDISTGEALAIIAGPLRQVNAALDGQTFLETIQNRSGILVERESGVYGFAHKTFQEFFTAAHIQQERLVDELARHITEDWWHEAVRLYCARVDATPILAACLADDPPPLPVLVLAIQCVEEALRVQPEVRQQLEQVLEQDIESEDPERRRNAAGVRLALRLKRLERLDDDTYADTSLITHAEYQLFLDENGDEEVGCIPDHWDGDCFTPGQGRSPAVGVSHPAAQAFCRWLSDREPDTEWHFRLPRVEESGGAAASFWLDGGALHHPQPVDLPFGQWVLDGDAAPGSSRLSTQRIIVTCYQADPVLSRARTLAHALDRALDRTLEIARDCNLSLARNHILDNDLAGALDLAYYRNRDPDLASYPNRALAVYNDLARVFDHSLARAFDRTRDTDRNRALTLDLVLDRDLALARELTHHRALTLDHALDLALDRAHALDRVLDRARPLDPKAYEAYVLMELFRDVAYLIAGYMAVAPILEGYDKPLPMVQILKPLNALDDFRKAVLDEANRLYAAQPRRPRRGRSEEWDAWKENLDQLLQLYATLAMLERRRRGEWQAFEGIRIVKVRQEA